MKIILFLTIISTITSGEVGKWGVEEDANVVVLTQDNFAQFVQDHPKVFVKFYAPWCGHCKQMAPGYSSLAGRMNAAEDGIPIAKVDCTVHAELAKTYDVQGYPTLKYFVNGKPVDYKGGREENDLFNWLQKRNGPASTELTTEEQMTTHSGMSLSVLFVGPADATEALQNYMALAMEFDDVSFAHTSNDTLRAGLDLQNDYALVVFRDFDDGRKVLGSDTVLTTENMKSFFEGVRFPVVMSFDQKAAEKIFGSQSSAMFYFTDDASDSGLSAFREFAKENTGSLLFSHSTVTTDLGARLSEYVGVTTADAPCVRVVKFVNGELQKYKVGTSVEELAKGLAAFNEDTLSPFYKSQPVPETNDEPVKVLVGDNFDDMVLNSDKWVLVEAYAPWCGHCKKLEPIYTELAEKLATVEDLVIAKMDSTLNEHSAISVKGFPTLKLFSPGNATPIDYTGDRSLNDLVTFLETQMNRKFDNFEPEEL